VHYHSQKNSRSYTGLGLVASVQAPRHETDLLSPHPLSSPVLVEHFFNKIKECRRVAMRYARFAAPTFIPAQGWARLMISSRRL
jgi:hypothetical protein